jgi:peptidoglycan/LPS O-acetylase OafA/YrhL
MALIFSSMIYSAQDFASLGANTAAAAFSAINIKLLFQGSYFKLSPDAQPILHYWSLAVEEQFYLLFPIYLFWIARFRRRLTINLLVCAASFVLCVIVTYHNAKYAFYLLPTRAWELLGGATLAIVERQHLPSNYRAASIASWTGLALLLVALFTIDPGGYFPGWIASLPVLGTILILSSTAEGLDRPRSAFLARL